MKRIKIIAAGFTVCLLATGLAGAGDTGAEKKEFQFIGAKKCKMCHNSTKQGKIYTKWAKGPHARAYEVLASDAAKKIASEKGIDDPQKSDACLKCHVTGHGADAKLLGKKYSIEEGVSCESCHGAGSGYWKKKTMQAITDGKQDAAEVGLTMPDEATCAKCHNGESPGFKGFDFDEMFAKIEHRKPPAK